MNKGRILFGCTVFNRMLYVVGGDEDIPHPVALVYRYDPINKQWTDRC